MLTLDQAGEAAGHPASGCHIQTAWGQLDAAQQLQHSAGQPALQHCLGGSSFVNENMSSGLMALSLLKVYFLLVLTERDASGNVSPREDKKLRQRLIDSSCWCFPAAAGGSFVLQQGFSSAFTVLNARCCSLNATVWIAWQFLRGQVGLQTTYCIIISNHVPEKACCRLSLFIKKSKHTRNNKNKKFLSWVTTDMHWMQLKLAAGKS